MHFKLIVTLIEDTKTKAVLEAARDAGATGSTVINQARGEGIEKSKELHLYRQEYCGCIYSERDRYMVNKKPDSIIEREKNEN